MLSLTDAEYHWLNKGCYTKRWAAEECTEVDEKWLASERVQHPAQCKRLLFCETSTVHVWRSHHTTSPHHSSTVDEIGDTKTHTWRTTRPLKMETKSKVSCVVDRDIHRFYNMVETCKFYQENRRTQRKKTLYPTSLPERLCQWIATDICEYGAKHYIVMSDYYHWWSY